MTQVSDLENLHKMYNASFKSKFTARAYTTHLKKYAQGDLVSLLRLTQREAEDRLIDFIITNKEKGMAWGALHNYVAAVARFYLINDFTFNTNRVNRFMPEESRVKKDRAYTDTEIYDILEISTERTRATILLLCSSGMRLGGLAGLQLCDLEDRGDFYKITVYKNTKSEYYTYCSPEAKRALTTYLEVRKRHGELIDLDRPIPLIREQYNHDDQFSARSPKPTTTDALEKIIEDLLIRSGLRQRIPRTETAYTNKKEISATKGFRKFFNTQLVKVRINPLIKEMLMGHKVGLEENYYRPQEDDVQAEYEKAIDVLTINPENRLKRKVEMLTIEKSKVDLALSEIQEMKKKIGLS